MNPVMVVEEEKETAQKEDGGGGPRVVKIKQNISDGHPLQKTGSRKDRLDIKQLQTIVKEEFAKDLEQQCS